MAARHPERTRRSVTAKPKPVEDVLARDRGLDVGLSIDPEDIGARTLEEATEAKGRTPRSASEVSLTDPPPTDDALPGPAFEEERTVWAQSVEQTIAEDPSGDRPPPPDPEEDEDALDDLTVDVTARGAREASLLDHEADVLGEVESPDTETDDTDRARKRVLGERI